MMMVVLFFLQVHKYLWNTPWGKISPDPKYKTDDPASADCAKPPAIVMT
jgi:hypothetical protein